METIKKECKVVMLPCKNSNKGIYKSACSEKLHYFDKRLENSSQSYYLYILSDDEIKEGDYLISITGNILKCNNPHRKEIQLHSIGKIIATTDSFLNLPQPSQAFIKKYCELNGEIDKVMVEYYQQYYHSINDEDNGTNSWTKISKEEFEIKSSKRDYFDEFDFKEWLKTNSKNEISISSVKNNWNREEIEELINKSFNEGFLFGYRNGLKEDLVHKETIKTKIKNWIKENL